jgi:ParB family protein of integrating conjugative element (PFGI_1 class)
LAILHELWQETHDERFFRLHCLFRPWRNETTALLGHLAESDLHGQLTFIERALAVAKLKSMLEPDGVLLSQRELARRLSAEGYPVSQSHISRMLDTLEHLLPAIPHVLYAGLGKPQIERLIGLRRQAERTWNHYPTSTAAFAEVWLETLGYFDTEPEAFALERIQDELLERMSRLLGRPHRLLALELSDTPRAISTPGVVAPTAMENAPLPIAEVEDATRDPLASKLPTPPTKTVPQAITEQAAPLPTPETGVTSAVSSVTPAQQARPRITLDTASAVTPSVESSPIETLWTIAPALDSPACLRLAISALAREMATYAGHPESIIDQQQGLGFSLNPEHLDLTTPRATGIHLLLLALLRAQDKVNWDDRQQLPSALFGQILLGVYQLPLTDQPAMDVGLERLPDRLLLKLFRLIRLARRLIDLTLAAENSSPEKQP